MMRSRCLRMLAITVNTIILSICASPSSKASKRPAPLYHDDGFPRWSRQNRNARVEELPLLQNMRIAELAQPQEGWPQREYQMSSGPSLATRMMEQEEEDTAASSSMTGFDQSECRLNEEDQLEEDEDEDDLGEEGSQVAEASDDHHHTIQNMMSDDPTSLAILKASKARWNYKAKAWHTGLTVPYRNFMKAVVDGILSRKEASSAKAFRRVYQSFTEDMIEELKLIHDTKHGWARHEAVIEFVDRYMAELQWKKDSRAFENSWTNGLEEDEIAELRQLLKESRRMKGTKFLNALGVDGRRRAMVPGTVENERFLNPRNHPYRPRRDNVEKAEHSESMS